MSNKQRKTQHRRRLNAADALIHKAETMLNTARFCLDPDANNVAACLSELKSAKGKIEWAENILITHHKEATDGR